MDSGEIVYASVEEIIGKTGSRGGITYPALREILEPLGVEEFDLSSLFFNLDIKHDGAISLEDFGARWDAAVKACPRFAARSDDLLRDICEKLKASGTCASTVPE